MRGLTVQAACRPNNLHLHLSQAAPTHPQQVVHAPQLALVLLVRRLGTCSSSWGKTEGSCGRRWKLLGGCMASPGRESSTGGGRQRHA